MSLSSSTSELVNKLILKIRSEIKTHNDSTDSHEDIRSEINTKANKNHIHSYNDLTNKPSIPSKTSDLTNDSNFISTSSTKGLIKNDGTIDTTKYSTFSGSYNDLTNKPFIPTAISDLTNDSNFLLPSQTEGLMRNDGSIDTNEYALSDHIHDNATPSTNGFMSATDKAKLDGIAIGANKIIVDSSLSSSSTNPVQNKVINTALNAKATKDTATTSTNGLMSSSDKTKLDGIATGANKTIVDSSLSSSSTNPVQNKVINTALNNKSQVSFSQTKTSGIEIGKINIDGTETSIYQQDNNTTYSAATQSANGLMSSSDKTKLDGIATGANKITVDSSLSSTSTNPVQNKVINTALNTKATKDTATQSANGLMSSSDKTKLDGISTGANKTIVDSSLSSTSTNPVQNKVINGALNNKSQVSFTQTKTSGIEIGKISIDGTETPIYQQDNNTTYSAATTSANGLMSSSDKTKLNGIETGANKTIVDSALDGTSTNPVQNKVIKEKIDTLATKDEIDSITAGEVNLTGYVKQSDIRNNLTSTDTNKPLSAAQGKALNTAIGQKAVTVEKLSTATSGYAASYVVKQNGSQVGATINIPKDFLVKSASVKTCSTANDPVSGYKVGYKYLDFVVNTDNVDGVADSHLYILVSELVDIYAADSSSIELYNDNGVQRFRVKDGGITTGKLADSVYETNYSGTKGSKLVPTNDSRLSNATTSANGLMSSTDKAKLDGIATGANKITVDSSLSTTSTNPVQNKVINTALSGKASTDVATTSANGLMSSSDKAKLDGIATGANKITVDSSLSTTSTNPVQNKVINTALSGKASTNVATTSANGLMSSADKTKLDGIATGANKTTVDSSLSSTSANPVQNKVINSALNNKSQVSFTQTKTSGIEIGKINIDGTETSIYQQDNNTTYSTATQSANGLMSSTDKTKLDGIATGANKITVDSSLSTTSTNPVQNKVINSALSGKASTDVATTSTNGLMSSTDKAKLDGIATGANKIIVDSSLSSTSTNPVQNKVINTALNGKSDTGHTHNNVVTQVIPETADLNNYGTTGVYKNPANAQVAKMSNTPWQTAPPSSGSGTGYAFVMVVLDHAGCTQILRPYDKANYDIWTRNYYNNQWGAWKKVYTNGNLTKADITALGIPAQDTVYSHPNSGVTADTTGNFKKLKYNAQGHITGAVNVAKSDITGLGIPAQDTVYTHPNSGVTADTTGNFKKLKYNAQGHITGAVDVAKSDITALGIPAQDTVYTHPNSGVTAGTNYNDSQTPAFGATFNIPKLTFNAQGHITASANSTVKIPALPTASTNTAGIIQIGTGASNAAAGNHSHTTSQITNFPTTMTPTSHSHGSLANGGTLNSDISSVNKIAVTDSSNNLKTISKLPADKVTHQDISGKSDVGHTHTTSQITNFPTTMTPTSHAVDASTYGLATTGVYGHTKVIQNLTTNDGNGLALGAGQGKALKALVDAKWTTAPGSIGDGKAGFDYNDQKTPGSYIVWGQQQGNCTNAPDPNGVVDTQGGLLLIYSIPNGVVQILINYWKVTPQIFYRIWHNSGVWRSWQVIYTQENTPSASTTTKGIVQLINDLTTGGTDKALTAEQGKTLSNSIANTKPWISKVYSSKTWSEGFSDYSNVRINAGTKLYFGCCNGRDTNNYLVGSVYIDFNNGADIYKKTLSYGWGEQTINNTGTYIVKAYFVADEANQGIPTGSFVSALTCRVIAV